MIQIASVSTASATVRSEIHGWTFEDASLLVRRSSKSSAGKIFIGYTPAPKDIPDYGCVLEMLADGWELLGAPQRETWTTDEGTADEKQHEQWGWWLHRKLPQKVPA
jgi:hypothetical protein